MKLHIEEQVLEVNKGKFNIHVNFVEDTMEHDTPAAPAADTPVAEETPAVEVAVAEDAGVQAPALEVEKEEEVA